MNRIGRFVIGSFFVSIIGFVQPSYAVPDGCDPAKYTTMQQMGEVRVAYDVGATKEIVPKPDSVLDLSCFSQASQISAEKGGGIFASDFKTQLNNVIQAATTDIATNFSGSLMLQNGLPQSTGWNSASFNCDNMKSVWGISQSSGIETDANFMDMDQILATSMAPPPVLAVAPGNIMEYNLTAPTTAASATAVDAALTTPTPVIPTMNTNTNASPQLDTCDVMRNLTGTAVAGYGC